MGPQKVERDWATEKQEEGESHRENPKPLKGNGLSQETVMPSHGSQDLLPAGAQ